MKTTAIVVTYCMYNGYDFLVLPWLSICIQCVVAVVGRKRVGENVYIFFLSIFKRKNKWKNRTYTAFFIVSDNTAEPLVEVHTRLKIIPIIRKNDVVSRANERVCPFLL